MQEPLSCVLTAEREEYTPANSLPRFLPRANDDLADERPDGQEGQSDRRLNQVGVHGSRFASRRRQTFPSLAFSRSITKEIVGTHQGNSQVARRPSVEPDQADSFPHSVSGRWSRPDRAYVHIFAHFFSENTSARTAPRRLI